MHVYTHRHGGHDTIVEKNTDIKLFTGTTICVVVGLYYDKSDITGHYIILAFRQRYYVLVQTILELLYARFVNIKLDEYDRVYLFSLNSSENFCKLEREFVNLNRPIA